MGIGIKIQKFLMFTSGGRFLIIFLLVQCAIFLDRLVHIPSFVYNSYSFGVFVIITDNCG